MHIPAMGHLDWAGLLQALKTENVVRYLSGLDPKEFLTRPFSLAVELAALILFLFFRMVRTLAVTVGIIAIWCAIVYTLPHAPAQEISLRALAQFLGILLAVVVVWVYVFFIREG